MSVLSAGHYSVTGGEVTPSIPWIGDPGPGYVPPEPGPQGERWLVAVSRFPVSDGRPVVLWGAWVESLSIRDRTLGGNSCVIHIPTDPVSMRILANVTGRASEGVDAGGRATFNPEDAVAWEFWVGSDVDGKVRHKFVVRDQVDVSETVISVPCVGTIGGLTGDRVIGAPERLNLLPDPGFSDGTLSGWTIVGDGTTAGVVASSGVPDGSHKVWVKGTPDGLHYIEKRVRRTELARPWGRQRIAATSYVSLPDAGLEIDSYRLVTVGVEVDGQPVWPKGGPQGLDLEAGVVTSDMARGEFLPDPVVGVGYLPTPPFECDVIVRLHPVDETHRTYFGCRPQLIRRENTSTVTAKDLLWHVKKLFEHAQNDTSPGFKSTWQRRVEFGAWSGISEVGTWWHEDGQSLAEALGAVADRGVDIWDGPTNQVYAAKRRGAKRTDVQVNPWDVLGVVKWSTDPGAIRTSIRATSAANSIWGGADVGTMDTATAFGQVIDLTVSGPVGMSPKQLKAWVLKQLATVKVPQTTTSILVPWELGRRLSVGDTVKVSLLAGSAAISKWMTISAQTPNPEARFVMLDVGTEVA